MKGKILGIFVVALLITTALPSVGKMNSIQKNVVANLGDEIDQQQPTHTRNTFVIGEAYRAQSFVPTKNKLTRIELFIYKEGTMNADIVVSIRDNLHGSDLAAASKQANQIPSSTQTQDWVEFDFPDLQINAGTKYYIVCTTQGGDLDNAYVLGMSENDPYPLGNAWEYGAFTGYVWQIMEDYHGNPYDLSFKTYCQKGKAKLDYQHQLFSQFLENHQHMFPLLRQLLRL